MDVAVERKLARYIGTISRWHVATCRTDCNLRAGVVYTREPTRVRPLISRIPWIHRVRLTWLKMMDVAWHDLGYVSPPFSHPGGMETHPDYGQDLAESSRFESNSIKIKGRTSVNNLIHAVPRHLNETKIHIVELFCKIKGDPCLRCRILYPKGRNNLGCCFRVPEMEFLGPLQDFTGFLGKWESYS